MLLGLLNHYIEQCSSGSQTEGGMGPYKERPLVRAASSQSTCEGTGDLLWDTQEGVSAQPNKFCQLEEDVFNCP